MSSFIEFADEDAVRRARACHVSGTKLHVVSQSPQLVAHFLSIIQLVQHQPVHSLTPSSSRLALHAVAVKQEPREDRRLLKRVSEGEITSSNESTPRKKARRSEKNVDVKPSVSGDALSALSPDLRTPRARVKSPLSLHSPLNRQASDKENYAGVHTSSTNPPLPRMRSLPSRGDNVVASPKRDPVSNQDAYNDVSGMVRSNAGIQQADTDTLREGDVQNIRVDVLRAPSDVPALSPIITLTYHGQSVTCDLRKLEDDPAKIIAVLKAIASCALERDKWMIVAVQYRIKGLFQSAIGVLEAMIGGASIELVICAANTHGSF